jgi:hypothetical protein
VKDKRNSILKNIQRLNSEAIIYNHDQDFGYDKAVYVIAQKTFQHINH